jgi:hypothetical protein
MRETARLRWLRTAVDQCRQEVCIPWPFPLSGVAPLLMVDFALAYAHRVAYAIKYTSLPSHERLYQQCDTRHCVNPHHYSVVRNKPVLRSPRRRSHIKGQCPNGHMRTKENTYITMRGVKVCRICQGDAYKRFTVRKKGALHD